MRHAIPTGLAVSVLAGLTACTTNATFGKTVQTTGPVDVRVMLGEDLLSRAEGRGDRNTALRLRDGFASIGFLGRQELEDLADDLEDDIEDALRRDGFAIASGTDGGPAKDVLEVVLVDAVPNRPTANQLGTQPELSFSSFGVGGAAMEGVFRRADGQVTDGLDYEYFENNIIDPPQPRTTWFDANRAFERYSARVVNSLNR